MILSYLWRKMPKNQNENIENRNSIGYGIRLFFSVIIIIYIFIGSGIIVNAALTYFTGYELYLTYIAMGLLISLIIIVLKFLKYKILFYSVLFIYLALLIYLQYLVIAKY